MAREIAKIPYGQAVSYKYVAEYINTRAIRAVGSSCGKNGIPIFVPCHRVVPSFKHHVNVGQYSGGVEIKRYLLCHEGVIDK